MCGICGIALADTSQHVNVDELRRMNDALVHRGPDDDGIAILDNVGLAMRRLSIIDLEGGAQPIKTEDGLVQLVFNGEIYNYRTLREKLEGRGHRFASRSDTETIVHEYEDRAERVVESLRGMFAFALWDARRARLVLATDRFGIKPMYYAAGPWGIAFASELAALRECRRVNGDLDVAALAKYFTFGYIPHPDTIFTGVKKLPPASLLTWSPETPPSVACYWRPPYAERTAANVDIRADLRERLRDAVRSHLESDVPIGVFLSGGMDSASLVALMSEVTSDPIPTFSVGFEQQAYNELPMARLIAARFGTQHEEIMVRADAASVLPRLVRHFGEPFADSSALPTYYVSMAASERVKVALSGDGGDELFLGYTMFRGLEFARRLEVLPAGLRVRLRQLVDAGRAHSRGAGDRWPRLLKRASDSLAGTRSAYYGKLVMPGIPAVAPYLRGEVADQLARHDPYDRLREVLREELAASEQPLEPFVRTGLRFSLPGEMLVKVDRTSMANSLEVRLPFLYHELAEHVSALPLSERLPGGQLKGLLRMTMADALPAETIAGRKSGFTVPLAAWFSNGGLREMTSDVLLNCDLRASGLLDRRAIEQLLAAPVESLERATVLWSLLMFELWWTADM